MEEISLIRLDWNNWNGFIFQLLQIEIGRVDAALFGIYIYSKLQIDILFISFTIIFPWEKNI